MTGEKGVSIQPQVIGAVLELRYDQLMNFWCQGEQPVTSWIQDLGQDLRLMVDKTSKHYNRPHLSSFSFDDSQQKWSSSFPTSCSLQASPELHK